MPPPVHLVPSMPGPHLNGLWRWFVAPSCLVIVLASCTTSTHAITLADAAALPIGTQVTIDEALVINSTKMTVAGLNLIQVRDDTRAVSIFAEADGVTIDAFLAGATAGDVISFTATTLNYFGLLELTELAGPAAIVATPTIDTSIAPVQVSPVDFDDFSPTAEGLESRYVELQDVELFYGWPSLNQNASAGRPVAGETFQYNTTYIARDGDGNESVVWARSQASVDSLNAHFGTIPAGPFNLTGIFLHAFDSSDPLPGTAGMNYLLNPVFITLPGDLDGDGFVGIADLNIILPAWNQTVTPGDLLSGDPTGDGFVGIADLNLVLTNWNAGSPPGTEQLALVPEPRSCGVILVLGGLAVLRCPRGSETRMHRVDRVDQIKPHRLAIRDRLNPIR